MNALLEIHHVNKAFDGLVVLDDVNLSLPQGSFTALFGENGSGKTTLFHILSGFQPADGGSIRYGTTELTGRSPIEISRAGVGRLWQTPRLFKNLSCLDNLLAAWNDHPGEKLSNYLFRPAATRNAAQAAKVKSLALLAEVGLSDKAKAVAGTLSFGQQKLLSLGMLLMNGAEFLLIDEPFAGLNAIMVDHIAQTLRRLCEGGRSICMIEHNRAKAMELADQVYTVSKGKIIAGNV